MASFFLVNLTIGLVIDQAESVPFIHEAQIGIVLPQDEAVFGA